jgi:large subunit ribosomal protein L9
MQIILLEKMANLGGLGEVVKVKQGYARNYLIPQGKAKRATEAALKEFESRRAELERAQSDKLAAAEAEKVRLDGQVLQMGAKAGVDGRLFGSVTNHDVADALAKQGYPVHKAQIRMPNGPLKAVGEHHLSVALHTDVIAEITVNVVGEAQ